MSAGTGARGPGDAAEPAVSGEHGQAVGAAGPGEQAGAAGPGEQAGAAGAAGPGEHAGRGPADRAGSAGGAERRPVSVYGVGDEPDPRFTLANERTALAWMRTALALVGGGVALISVAGVAALPKWSALIGASVCVGGALLAWRAVNGWARVERALRLGQQLPAPRALVWLAGGVIILGALTLALTILQLVGR